MTKRLTVQNASITTAAVEVKTLTISGKQVTLAVFRQLREEPLIADDGTLNGQPWGYVNYHPDKCADATPHWHVVWQRGDELLRSRVSHAAPGGKFWSDAGDRFISAHVREVLEHRGRHLGGQMPTFTSGTTRLNFAAPFPVEVAHDDVLRGAIRAWKEWRTQVEAIEKTPSSEYYREGELHLRGRLAAEVERLSSAPPEPHEVDELHAAFQAEVEEEEARRQRHRDVRVAIADLPQLFIAV